jgi:hypothetical protein
VYVSGARGPDRALIWVGNQGVLAGISGRGYRTVAAPPGAFRELRAVRGKSTRSRGGCWLAGLAPLFGDGWGERREEEEWADVVSEIRLPADDLVLVSGDFCEAARLAIFRELIGATPPGEGSRAISAVEADAFGEASSAAEALCGCAVWCLSTGGGRDRRPGTCGRSAVQKGV